MRSPSCAGATQRHLTLPLASFSSNLFAAASCSTLVVSSVCSINSLSRSRLALRQVVGGAKQSGYSSSGRRRLLQQRRVWRTKRATCVFAPTSFRVLCLCPAARTHTCGAQPVSQLAKLTCWPTQPLPCLRNERKRLISKQIVFLLAELLCAKKNLSSLSVAGFARKEGAF